MHKKKNWAGIMLLWFIFLAMAGCIAYLSFQNGADTKAIGSQVVDYFVQYRYMNGDISEKELLQFTYEVRQFCRIIAFFALGMVGTITVHLSLKKSNWVIKTGLTSVILFFIAYATEKFKVYIPSRHYSYDEMMLSMTAVLCGFVLVTLVTLTFGAVKNVFKLIMTIH